MKTTTFAGIGLASRCGFKRCLLGALFLLCALATKVTAAVWVEAGYQTYSGVGWIPVWVDGHWVVVQHVEGHWETQTVAGYWEDQWVDGHNESVWFDGYWQDQWNDGHWEDQWNDGYWEDQWNDGHWEDQWNDGYEDEEGNWHDGYWSSNWVDGYWSSNWVDGYWSSNWLDGNWSSNWVDGHWEDQWVDGYWTPVWIPETTQNVWVNAYDISEWVDGGWTLAWGPWTVTVWVVAHWEGPWTWTPFDTPLGDWSYSAWSPDPATVFEGIVFQQSRTASRPHRTGESNEAEEERNVVTGTQTAGPFYQDATGTKPFTWTPFDEPGPWYYSAWSPDPATQPNGQTFQQQRTAYRDHRIGQRNELDGERNVTISTETGETSYQDAVGTAGGSGKPTPVGTFADQIVYNQGLQVVDSSMLNAVFRDPSTSAVLSGTVTYSAFRLNTGETLNPFVPANSAPGNPGMSAFYGALQVTATFQATATYNAATVTAIFQNRDNQGPSIPGNFRRVVVGPNSFSVAWEPSFDNSLGPPELITYQLTLNGGAPFPASSGITHTFTGVAPNTQHTVEVRARDYFGNLSAPATVTVTTPAAGTDPGHERRWFDVNGDGIPDEIVGGDSGVFYYYAAETQTTTVTSVNWTTEYWPFSVSFGDGFFGFNWWWVPVPGVEYDTYTVNSVRPKFIFTTDPDYEYTICRVLSPTQYVRLFPPASGLNGEWQPSGFWPEEAYNALPFAFARISKPLGFVSVAGVTTGALGGNRGLGGVIDILLPSGGAIINVSDLANQIIKAGPQIVVDVWDAINNVQIGSTGTTVGGILNTANIGITTSGEWQLGFRFGETTMAWITLRTAAPVLEPITLAGGVPPLNPSGFEMGATRSFQVRFPGLLTTAPSDNDVTWSVVPAGAVTFAGGNNKGKTVTVTGAAPGIATLEVNIAGHGEPKPTVTTHIFSPAAAAPFNTTTVKISPYVVRNDSGSSPAISAARIASLIAYANTVFKQAGIVFTMAPIVNIDIPSYLDISSGPVVGGEKQYHEALQLTSLDYGTGGLEVYFVNTIEGIDGLAISGGPNPNASGIILASGSLQLNKAFAHELGHACGWPDIYVTRKKPDGSVDAELPTDKVKQAWLPADWNSGPDAKYYDNIQQRGLVEKLLMHGHGLPGFEGSIAIPRGAIYGLPRIPLGAAPVNLNVGLNTMNRNPMHP